ncbi:MAG: NAD(P)H-hydrate dehydratase [Oscillospiraceae bacterium]|nr:NAD(P)H-hydrate dehydratase [Oscillospiraceae bacterium]
MKLTNSTQMREMDKYAIEDLGIAGTVLMSNAAKHIAEAAMEHLSLDSCAAVFCGTGNNGGDGIGAAAYLKDKGVPVRAFLIGNEENLTSGSKQMLRLFDSLDGSLEPFSDSADLEEYLGICGVIIDAITGIGLNSDLQGDALRASELINASGTYVVAADMPSGVNADTGTIMGGAVKADTTVTFSLAKQGHFIEPGCIQCGEIRVREIGIPPEIVEGAVSYVHAVTRDDVSLPHRRPDTHKGNYGRCLIVAGSVGYTGAPALSARAASRMGAGLVFLGAPKTIYDILATKLDEEMPFGLPDDKHGRLSANASGEILRRADECDVCLIGPGLGCSLDITEMVLSAIRIVKTPIILDADGINAISGHIEVLDQAAGQLVLTPHGGEFARLGGNLGCGDRLREARMFAMKHRCILVLKGHSTITALPDGAAFINTSGNPAMAKGGAGDVLSGMIASLVGQKFPIEDAVYTAVYLHGLAGDMCAAEYGEYSVTASDIIAMLPKAIQSVTGA